MSKANMAALVVMVLAGLLTGCANTEWVKPGATAQMRERQLTECEAGALKLLPPDNEVWNRHSESKKKWDGKKNESEQDTNYWTEDANEEHREVIVKDCMYQAGWSEQKLK